MCIRDSPYAMQPQSIMEEQESRRELYDGLKRLTQREQTYLLYRYGFTDGEEHPLIGTAIYFHLTKGRAQKTEEQAMDNLLSLIHIYAPLAQLVEQLTLNQWAQGSSPWRCTRY